MNKLTKKFLKKEIKKEYYYLKKTQVKYFKKDIIYKYFVIQISNEIVHKFHYSKFNKCINTFIEMQQNTNIDVNKLHLLGITYNNKKIFIF